MLGFHEALLISLSLTSCISNGLAGPVWMYNTCMMQHLVIHSIHLA